MIVNLTPHTVRINDGREFPPSGQVARVAVRHIRSGRIYPGEVCPEEDPNTIQAYWVEYGEVQGLPAPTRSCNACEGNTCPGMSPGDTCGEKVFFIVSSLVAQAAKGRNDLLVPATGHPDAVRKDGQVFSVPGFVRG